MTRGMGWGTFFLIFAAAFFYMIWAVLYGGNVDRELRVTPEAASRAPTEAIAAMMSDLEGQGYTVEHTKDLEQDPENVQRVIIEYVLTKPGTLESWTYTWAWEVPITLTDERIMRETEPDIVQRQYQLCRLIPLSEPAVEAQENLDAYIASMQ
jgi:hypothetical protein